MGIAGRAEEGRSRNLGECLSSPPSSRRGRAEPRMRIPALFGVVLCCALSVQASGDEECSAFPVLASSTCALSDNFPASDEPGPSPPAHSDHAASPSFATSSINATSSSTTSLPERTLSSSTPTVASGSVPELVSFAEWRARQAASQSPLHLVAHARRGHQRARQGQMNPLPGSVGVTDGDEFDVGSLFFSADVRHSDALPQRELDSDKFAARGDGDSSALSNAPPIVHPLPDTGTSLPSDPLPPLRSRTNYASFDCSALIHRSSPFTRSASAILSDSKDRYMLTPCSAEEKFVIIELCDEVEIDTLVLANYEFFSSTFKLFRVRVSANYAGGPAGSGWTDLGIFRASNVRGLQVRAMVSFVSLEYELNSGKRSFVPRTCRVFIAMFASTFSLTMEPSTTAPSVYFASTG
jgi:hypothetical protein